MDINREISRLINYGLQKGLIFDDDKNYISNRLISLLNIDEFVFVDVFEELAEPSDILSNIMDFAYDTGVLKENTIVHRDLFDSEVMNILLKRPSEVIRDFYNDYEKDKEVATNNYYHLSKSSNYIRTSRTNKNIVWKTKTDYGDIVITINKSKPEKDPKAIALAKNLKSSSYPKCFLCKENEGYKGRLNHPGRANHRIIPFTMNNEEWYMQYSPYVYFNEHTIVFKKEHEPMNIDENTFSRLLSFTQFLPHYFLGSNAGLPIVGGSILSHEHYQGGNYVFPMENAKVLKEYDTNGVKLQILKWPLSVIRLRGEKDDLIEMATHILKSWENYSNDSLNIINKTTELHNAITPIARFKNGLFELDLTLRNNITTLEYPDGLFHPHPDKHHIKKENIGLIEVLGLAVLPARLDTELNLLKDCLLDKSDIKEYDELVKHIDFYNMLKDKYDLNEENIEKILRDEVGCKFASCLEDSGVFKQNAEGLEAFKAFIESMIL